jgi:outer membrane autotransporter protein
VTATQPVFRRESLTPANVAPTANAGPDQTVASATAPVTLDGTGSSDPDVGQTLTYAWTQTAGSAVTLSDPTAASPTFTAPTLAAGDADVTLTFSLIVTDNLGLASTADTVTITVTAPLDTRAPSVVLSSATTTLTDTSPFTVTATFDENVTGFVDVLNDVTIINGSVTLITGGPSVYALTVTPTGAGDVLITVPAAAAQDVASNGNTVSNTLVIGNQIVAVTQEQIAGFMLNRANKLASNQFGLTRFLRGEGCGTMNADATQGSGSINGCASRGNTWAAISSSWSDGDSYTLGTIGAHGFVNPNMLIGGMIQFDRAEDSANNTSGTGYMVGPYFVAKAAEQPFYFEGRLLYGQTNNDISPLDTYTDRFSTERLLAQLRATGEYKLESITVMPLLDLTYTDDAQKGYTDSLGNMIPGQKVSLMQFTAGMDFSMPISVQTGSLELTGGLSGIYSSSTGAAATPEFENWRGRTHLGLNYGLENGANLIATGFYDGIGTNDESYGASLGLDWKF